MTIVEYQTAAVPAPVQRSKPRHIEDLGEVSGELLEKIRSGKTYLKIVAYPWGTEFDLCDKEAQA
ncbi:MAG: hypothetical protein OK438_08540 [Thaumarchaeota archaeon]|nr:hypothetical protein [Nitrososphaerota archaeon]